MKIGLYFGSFNPIHIGHLIIARHVLNETDVKKIWFVVSPQNPLKEKSTLLNARHRLHLVQLAIEDEINFKACDIELKLPQPSYTIHTLIHLKEKYPQHEFTIIMGSDSFTNLHHWKNGDIILNDYVIYVYQRKNFEPLIKAKNSVLLTAPILDISASQIRQMIQEKKSLNYLVSPNVAAAIATQGYYQK